ncbi:hypothetical protein [Pseudomonas phage D6]|nr:hypothetical protein [Pseudomonas phage D6]
MGNKRKSFRQADGSIPVQSMSPSLPMTATEFTEQAAVNDKTLIEKLREATPEDRDYVNAWTLQATDGGPSEANLALTWFMQGNQELVDRWFKYNVDEPTGYVYDVFTKEELEFTGADFTGQDVEDAVDWIINQYRAYKANEEIEMENAQNEIPEGSNDELTMEPTADTSDQEPAFDYAKFRTEHGVPDSWTDEHVDQWIATGGNVIAHTERGSVVSDPTRKDREISTWGVDEILDGFEGKLDGIGENQYSALAKAYRQLVAVDAAWSVRDLIDFLTQGLEPAKTSNGAWRNDVTRARRTAAEWTTQELVAWALGEIRSVGETTDQKVSTELNKRLDLCSQSNKPEDVIRAYKKLQSNSVKVVGEQPTAVTPEPTIAEPVVQTATVIPQGLTAMNAAYLKTQTERYLKACAPGTPITVEIGTKEQKELDNLFRYILKLEDPVGFGNAMAYFRDFYKKHRTGLFEPTYATRFTGTLRTDGDVQETHVNLLTIFHVYTDDDKAARKQIDLPYLLRKFPASHQGWLLEFFQRYC